MQTLEKAENVEKAENTMFNKLFFIYFFHHNVKQVQSFNAENNNKKIKIQNSETLHLCKKQTKMRMC